MDVQTFERRRVNDPTVSPLVDRRKRPWVTVPLDAAPDPSDPWAHVRDRDN